MAAKVDAEEVIKCALDVSISSVKVNQKLLSVPPDNKGDLLLALRNHYLKQTEIVRRERGNDTDRRTKEKEIRQNCSSSVGTSDETISEKETLSYIPAFSNENLFDADESLLIKVAELRQVASMCDRFFNVNLFMRKWVDCLSLLKSEFTRYILADQLLREALSTGVHIRIVSFLLAVCGSDPNSQDLFLYTPLHIAAMNNRPDAARLLMMCGGDLTVFGALGFSSRGRMKLAADVIANISHVSINISNWPATLVLLRGKCCVNCNILVPSAAVGPVKCFHCNLTLCTGCAVQHWCVNQLVKEESETNLLKKEQMAQSLSGNSILKNGAIEYDVSPQLDLEGEKASSAKLSDASLLLDGGIDIDSNVSSTIGDDSFDFIAHQNIPVNWMGYRGLNLKGPQPWQKLMLPLLFDLSDLEFCETGVLDVSHNNTASIAETVNSSLYFPIRQVYLDKLSNTLEKSVHGLLPKFLYYRDEIKETLKLLYRDSCLISFPRKKEVIPCVNNGTLLPVSSELIEDERKRLVVDKILSRSWEMKEDSALWMPDELAWNCRECFVQFSMFQRKHVSNSPLFALIFLSLSFL